MSKYKPGLDDDRLVSQALSALADETGRLEAPPALEARLRASFVGAAGAAVETSRRPRAWSAVAALAATAGLAWLAIASFRADPGQPTTPAQPRTAASDPAAVVAVTDAAPKVAPPVAPVVRRAATSATRAARRPPRRPPTAEHFEPLYPGDLLADLDAVHLVRVSVPRSTLATLGWPSRADQGGRDRVELDAMVGPDGVARAVRFVKQ